MSSDGIRDLLEKIILGLVDDKDHVKVEKTSDEMGVLYSVDVAPEERGKIIGKQGRNAIAIRGVIRALAFKHDIRASIKIVGDRPQKLNDEVQDPRDQRT